MYKIYSRIGLQHIFPIRTVRRRMGCVSVRLSLPEHFGLTSVCKYSCAFTTEQCDTEKNIKGRAGEGRGERVAVITERNVNYPVYIICQLGRVKRNPSPSPTCCYPPSPMPSNASPLVSGMAKTSS